MKKQSLCPSVSPRAAKQAWGAATANYHREPAPSGRTVVEMDTSEYERMRDALGEGWEWRGLVRIRESR